MRSGPIRIDTILYIVAHVQASYPELISKKLFEMITSNHMMESYFPCNDSVRNLHMMLKFGVNEDEVQRVIK